MTQAFERRPIAARNWRVSQIAAAWLVRRRVSANTISVCGMGCGVLAGAVLPFTVLWPQEAWIAWLAAGVLVQARLVANMLDGMVALASGGASKVGELFNEIPDRISDSAILIGVGYASGGSVALGYSAALAAMFTAYVRAVGKGIGAGQEFCGPMAKQQRMFLITFLAAYGFAIDSTQRAVEPALGLSPVTIFQLIIVLGCIVTTVRRLWRINVNLGRTS